jgi:hypothetical protein
VLEALDVEGVGVVEELSRLRLARLHAELSRCMYSEHGFEPLMRPVLQAVCQWLMVVSNWHARVGALPRRLGDLAHDVAGLDGLHDLAVGDGAEVPVGRRPRRPA